MRTLVVVCGIALVATSAWSFDALERSASDSDVARVLARDPIEVESRGRIPIAYPDAVRMLGSPTLLADVQAAYARLLPPGEQPEFQIAQTGPTTYSYVNRSGQHTAIREVYRGECEGPATEVLFFSAGRRFFGDFEAVIYIAAEPDDAGARYRVRVYAYPENRVSRFFARHLRLVQIFFRSKTAEIERLSIRIAQGLCGTGAPGPSAG